MRTPRGYCFMRAKSIGSVAKVVAAIRHDKREREVKNAFCELTNDNGWIIGNPDDDHVKIFKDKIKSVKGKIRKNAIYAKMIVISASPEFFRPHAPYSYGVYDPAITHLFEQAAKRWVEAELKCFVLYMVSHLDEGSPHIHCLVIPLTDDNELNHEYFFGGHSSRMEQIQDKFATYFYELGLERGRKGSWATHIDIEKYYNNVMRPLQPLPELPVKPTHPGPEPVFGYLPKLKDIETKKKYEDQLKKYHGEMEVYNKQLMEAYKKSYDMCIQYQQKAMHCEFIQDNYDDLLDKLSNLEMSVRDKKSELKTHAQTDLYVLMEDYFGIQQAPDSLPQDGYKIYLASDNQRLCVYPNENHWQYSSGMRGGKGAVTLLAELLDPASPGSNVAVNKALAFINKNFGRKQAINDYAFHLLRRREKVINEIPIPQPKSESARDQALKIFSEQYHIPHAVLTGLVKSGKVSADYNQNLIFPFDDLTGYFTRSSDDPRESPKPRFSCVTPKTQEGAYSVFPQAPNVVVVADPMDVVAVHAIDSEACGMVFNFPSPKLVERCLKNYSQIVWGIALEGEEYTKLKVLIEQLCNSSGIALLQETRLSTQKDYKTWHKLLKNNPQLLNAGVLPPPPKPEPRTPAPRLRPVRYRGPRMR